ncbi:triphosphoribosyl-dephospho-CoA synthase [Brevibacillus fluminis]|uniref:triphosphoribosyl-dephospho-CoA synthase n=2 Tax=Brevibacillus fluminis TaxID=511487 RepID=A0A3M8DNY2_9BACL|nr:triphosphoribosyl-dephospho-CoA synthase [Brevibacillus fluminis]
MVGRLVPAPSQIPQLVSRMSRINVSLPAERSGERLSQAAICALIEEAELTPKPGLVDLASNGSHADMDIELMRRSAQSLTQTFREMAEVAFSQAPSQWLRERLAAIGRAGESMMLQATGGVNTHKGAIWALGLLTAGAAIEGEDAAPALIAKTAGEIACFPDRWAPVGMTNGARVRQRYGVRGAAEEAKQGFPHVISLGLPALQEARARGASEVEARLDALVALIASVDDTCILHRGGEEALREAKKGADAVMQAGGTSTEAGRRALVRLDGLLTSRNASPGGSADLLAATLFLDRLHNLTGGV